MEENESSQGFMKTDEYALFEKIKPFIDTRPDRVWSNGRKSIGRIINDRKEIRIYFEHSDKEGEISLDIVQFMERNNLTEEDLTNPSS